AGAHTQLAVVAARGDPGQIARHHKGRNASIGRLGPGVGLGKDEKVMGHIGQADPDLFAVEDVDLTLPLRRGAHGLYVGTSVRFGEAKTANLLAARLRRPEALLLLLRPPLAD